MREQIVHSINLHNWENEVDDTENVKPKKPNDYAKNVQMSAINELKFKKNQDFSQNPMMIQVSGVCCST